MSTEAQKEQQESRLRNLLQTGNRVWNKRSFPLEHRPDIDVISANLQIGNKPMVVPRVHPQLEKYNPGITQEVAVNVTHRQRHFTVSYQSDIRRVFVNENALSMPDAELRLLLFFGAATDLSQRLRIIKPDQYTPEQNEKITRGLTKLFDGEPVPPSARTTIRKVGYQETARLDGQSIMELVPEEALMFQNIYPEIHAAITEQVLLRGGDLDRFDYAAQAGLLKVDVTEDRANFLATFFRTLKEINWRHLLTAFKADDFLQTVQLTEQHAKSPERGRELLEILLFAYLSDEQLINKLGGLVDRRKRGSN